MADVVRIHDPLEGNDKADRIRAEWMQAVWRDLSPQEEQVALDLAALPIELASIVAFMRECTERGLTDLSHVHWALKDTSPAAPPAKSKAVQGRRAQVDQERALLEAEQSVSDPVRRHRMRAWSEVWKAVRPPLGEMALLALPTLTDYEFNNALEAVRAGRRLREVTIDGRRTAMPEDRAEVAAIATDAVPARQTQFPDKEPPEEISDDDFWSTDTGT